MLMALHLNLQVLLSFIFFLHTYMVSFGSKRVVFIFLGRSEHTAHARKFICGVNVIQVNSEPATMQLLICWLI